MAKTPAKVDDIAPATIVGAGNLALRQEIADKVTNLGLWSDAAFVDQILAAETFEEAVGVLGEGGTLGARDVFDVALEVQHVKFAESAEQYRDAEGGLGLFAIIDAVNLGTGERVTITTGANQPVALLVRSVEKGWLPAKLMFTQADQTAAGFRPVNLVPAEW